MNWRGSASSDSYFKDAETLKKYFIKKNYF